LKKWQLPKKNQTSTVATFPKKLENYLKADFSEVHLLDKITLLSTKTPIPDTESITANDVVIRTKNQNVKTGWHKRGQSG
jgi:hypothetical protein